MITASPSTLWLQLWRNKLDTIVLPNPQNSQLSRFHFTRSLCSFGTLLSKLFALAEHWPLKLTHSLVCRISSKYIHLANIAFKIFHKKERSKLKRVPLWSVWLHYGSWMCVCVRCWLFGVCLFLTALECWQRHVLSHIPWPHRWSGESSSRAASHHLVSITSVPCDDLGTHKCWNVTVGMHLHTALL